MAFLTWSRQTYVSDTGTITLYDGTEITPSLSLISESRHGNWMTDFLPRCSRVLEEDDPKPPFFCRNTNVIPKIVVYLDL